MHAHTVLATAHRRLVMNRRVRVLAGHVGAALDAEGKVLDVGCGDGTLARAVMAERPGLEIHGIDLFLRPRVAIPAQSYDGARIPHEDGSFDFVTLVDVLHHTDDPGALLSEALRIARRGVVVKDHLVQGFVARPTLSLMDWVGNRGHGVRLPYNYLAKGEWRELFARCGARSEFWDDRLGIYPFPFSIAFDRQLHFVTRLVPHDTAAQRPAHRLLHQAT